MVDVQMVYVASDDYLVDFRKPNPGSERLVVIENPLSVFGDLEAEKAMELFSEYNFHGVMDKLSLFKENIPDPMKRQELNFTYLLAEVYRSWDALDFDKAGESVKELCRQIERDGRNYPGYILVEKLTKLHEQREYLSALSEIPEMVRNKKQPEILKERDIIVPLMFTMKMNAWTREQQDKYDMATLLTYRLLEMIEQRRLAKYNLFVSDMHYDKIEPNAARLPELVSMTSTERIDWLKKEVYEIKKGMFKGRVSDYLPNPVSLLEGFIILSALRDPIVYEETKNRMNILNRIRSMVYLRNNSIFAHGLGPVAREDYMKFRDFVLMMFGQFCKIEKIPYESMSEAFSWIIPGEKGE